MADNRSFCQWMLLKGLTDKGFLEEIKAISVLATMLGYVSTYLFLLSLY